LADLDQLEHEQAICFIRRMDMLADLHLSSVIHSNHTFAPHSRTECSLQQEEGVTGSIRWVGCWGGPPCA
jgi:hypothetical protein